MKAVLCPVCNGEGMRNGVPCHGCGDGVTRGRGWVEVQEQQYVYPYYIPSVPAWPWPGTITFTSKRE